MNIKRLPVYKIFGRDRHEGITFTEGLSVSVITIVITSIVFIIVIKSLGFTPQPKHLSADGKPLEVINVESETYVENRETKSGADDDELSKYGNYLDHFTLSHFASIVKKYKVDIKTVQERDEMFTGLKAGKWVSVKIDGIYTRVKINWAYELVNSEDNTLILREDRW